jgi:hypothetical protein
LFRSFVLSLVFCSLYASRQSRHAFVPSNPGFLSFAPDTRLEKLLQRWDVDELGGIEYAVEWMDLYFSEELYRGEHPGLYDIECHTPEGYVIRREEGTMYDGFLDEEAFDPEVVSRGLERDRERKGNRKESLVYHCSKPCNNKGEKFFLDVLKCQPI